MKTSPAAPDFTAARRFVVGGLPLYSIRGINELDAATQEAIYRILVPDELLVQYNIDLQTLCDPAGNRLVQFVGAFGPQHIGLVHPEFFQLQPDRLTRPRIQIAGQ